ncbi:hypothetical protein BHE74_00009709 [Ensete ventricosum]|uniref:Uncharacterized protein n=1 Tax=Ensete ventricosum TaxID=4639 RepID=A0A444DVK7_ENSVE|nr:hypothetical protein GW17_00034818 [Ensete ventricosum]RWW81860.1 hypothetical protein BHE74_00009709 [Ensete ventricosum]RZR70856.1 hypothetical protein BHM03_00001941 [Ensete ventricosum]
MPSEHAVLLKDCNTGRYHPYELYVTVCQLTDTWTACYQVVPPGSGCFRPVTIQNRPVTVNFDCRWPISDDICQGREKEEEGEEIPGVRAALRPCNHRPRAISSPAGDFFSPRGEKKRLPAGKAPYWAVRIDLPTDRYVDRLLPGDTALCVDGRLREKEEVREEEEGETCYPRAALPRFPHTIRRPWAILFLAGDQVHLRWQNNAQFVQQGGVVQGDSGLRKFQIEECEEESCSNRTDI